MSNRARAHSGANGTTLRPALGPRRQGLQDGTAPIHAIVGWKNPLTTENLQKMAFRLDPSEWHGQAVETLWAELVRGTTDGETYVIKNSPFFAKGVSFLDVVRGKRADSDLVFSSTVAGSGHSTYRIICDLGSRDFPIWWAKLQDAGCSYESTQSSGRAIYAVDVPDTADINAAYEVMEDGQSRAIWVFEEAHFGRQRPASVS